jgi:hypothetical protein
MDKEQEIRRLKEVMLPHVNSQLRPYQKEGAELMQKRSRWLECDDMG